jgi:hypothetical protein
MTCKVAYPYVKEVCELFDVTVLSDLECDEDRHECEVPTLTVYALGWHGEPEAGIRYGYMTAWFRTMGELESFCKANIKRFREASKACEDGAAIPDTSGWA